MQLHNFDQMDIHLLVSIINMKLRNDFYSLDELCHYYDIDITCLINKLNNASYYYLTDSNQCKLC